MAWIALVLSGIMESVWAIALSKSDGLSRLRPTMIFLGAIMLSMVGLAYATKTIPLGSPYAVWVGIDASITVIYSMAAGTENHFSCKGSSYHLPHRMHNWLNMHIRLDAHLPKLTQ